MWMTESRFYPKAALNKSSVNGRDGRLCLESVFYPLDVIAGIEQHSIETAGWGMRQSGEVMLSSEDKALLLACVDTGAGAAKIAAAALAHFGEDQDLSVAQDQVDLPETAMEIGLDQLQAALLQVLRCNLLGLSAGFHGRDLLSTGTPSPWRMMAGMPSRWNTCPVSEILPVTPSSGKAFAGLRADNT